MDGPVTNRGILRAALALAVTLALMLFGLLVAYRFVAGVAEAVLVILAALLLAVALSGPVEALHRRKVPRVISAVSIVLGVLGSAAGGVYLFLPVLAEQASELVFALPFTFAEIGEFFSRLAGRIGVPVEAGSGPSLSTLVGWGRRILGGALGLFQNVAFLAFGLVVAITVPVYLAANPEPVVAWTLKLLPPGRRPRALEVLVKVRLSLLNWLKGRLLSMTIISVLWTVALYFIGIPGALFLGILAGLLEFVPYVGPVLSTIPPLLLGLAGDPVDALWVLGSYLVIQQIEGYLVTPLVEGKTTALHPAAVIAAVTLAGSAFGFLGVFLAVPATVVFKVLIEELWVRRFEGNAARTG